MKPVSAFLLLVVSCTSVKLPSNFRKCNRHHPDLNQCTLRAAQDGLSQMTRPYPEFNIPSVRPFYLGEITIAAGTGPVAIDQKFHNCTVDGLYKYHYNTFEFDFEKKTLEMSGYFPVMTQECEFEVDGKILLLPVRGKGHSTIVLKNATATAAFQYEEVKKGGKTFMKMVSCKGTMEPELVSFNFENLFNGDKQLGENINRVINENWREVFDDVKKDYLEVVEKILLLLYGNFFLKVSMEEAFD